MEDEDEIPLDKPPSPPMSAADYHQFAQKQIMNAVFAALAEAKMEWATVAPFLEHAREICVGDFRENGRVRLHTTRADGENWIDAEEAFLGISVADRDDGLEWLSETWWLSDVATADNSRPQVEAVIAALERTIAKLRIWLNEGGGAAEATPPKSV